MEAGLALAHAVGPGCVICGGLAHCTLCSNLQQITQPPCNSKGGAEGLHQFSFTPHMSSSFLYHLSKWRSGLILPERKGGTKVSRSPSRVTFSYPEPCLFT